MEREEEKHADIFLAKDKQLQTFSIDSYSKRSYEPVFSIGSILDTSIG